MLGVLMGGVPPRVVAVSALVFIPRGINRNEGIYAEPHSCWRGPPFEFHMATRWRNNVASMYYVELLCYYCTVRPGE